MRRAGRTWHLVAAAGAALAVAGCASGPADKAGGASTIEPRALTLANANTNLGELQAWADEVARLSGGRLRIRVRSDWRQGDPHYEAGLIRDVEAGKADLGWVGSRAWAGQGVHGLDALHAPFLVDDYDLEAEVLRDPIAERMLASVSGAGVEGVALLPGPLRMLLARRPVEAPSDLAGLTIAVADSDVAAASLRRVGASAEPISSGATELRADGVEQQLEALSGNRYYRRARYLTADVPLWPRPSVVFANRRVWEGLDAAQQDVLRRAAGRAITPMLHLLREADDQGLAGLCAGGVKLVEAGAAGRVALRRAVEPVYEELRRDALTREALAIIARARAHTPQPAAPLSCPGGSSAGELPPGRYVATFRPGMKPGFGEIPRRFELVLGEGRAQVILHYADGREELGFDESYSVYRDTISFSGVGDLEFSAHWKLDGDRLTFGDFSSAEPGDVFVMGTHPWIRVGGK